MIISMKKLFFLLILVSLAGYSANAQNLEGKWVGKMGRGEVGLDIKSDQSSFTGIMYSPFGDNAIADGKIKGNSVSFSIWRGNGNKTEYSGTLNGDKLTVESSYAKTEFHRLAQGESFPVNMKPEMTEFYVPVPPVVDPGSYPGLVAPPSDAIALFDGTDLSKWKGRDGEAKWTVNDGVFTVNKGTGDIETKDVFEDFQLHIEWKIPEDIDGSGQARGNSGVFMQGIYELQVLDCYINTTYTNGQAGSIYKQTAPLVNAMRKPGEWNVYDVIYTAPRFREDGSVFSPARITVLHNGILIQNNFIIRGDTPYIGHPKYEKHGKGPIKLQDHGDPSKPISFRNIWIREL